MFDNDAWPTIGVAISIDDDRLIPVSITVAVSIDDDRLVAVTVPISISIGMNDHSVRSYADADIVSQNRRHGAYARDGAYNKGCADHGGSSLVQRNPKVNSRWSAIVPECFLSQSRQFNEMPREPEAEVLPAA
jgi:hypothetical protein